MTVALDASALLAYLLGDRACLALGRVAGLQVLTAEASWAALDLGASGIVVIR